MTLFPDVGAIRFDATVRELRSVVSGDWSFTSDEEIDLNRGRESHCASVPSFRSTEISDAEVDALAPYLAKQ
jgi:hypothetical protein